MAGLFPNYILRETNNDGKMLSGGRIYFYESGTYTPKTVYSDYTLSMPLTNPVVLDASGSADIWLGDGAYRVLITTSTGTQVRAPIDGITGTGGGAFGAGSNASVSAYKVYQDLRNDTNAPDVAYCCGATAIGDGGGGWFNRITTAEPDDNGICLVQGSTSYKRVFSGYISPEWYGVAYGVGVDQTYPINAAFAGSVRWNVPVRLTGSVYVSQNINIPSQASLYTMAGGYFVGPGPTAVQITLLSGSHIDGDSAVVFGDNIQPIFQAGVCDAIRLSWFGGDDDYVVWAKLDVSSTVPYQVLVDRTTTLDASNLSIATNLSLKFVAGCMVNFTGSSACNVDIVLDHDAPTQIMSFATAACVGTINLHNTKCYMEWFGGSPANTGNQNAIPFKCCMKAQRIDLIGGQTYTVTSTNPLSYSNPGVVRFVGNSSRIDINQDVALTVVETDQITIGGSGTFDVGVGAFLNSTIIMKLTGGAKHAQNSQLLDVNKIAQSKDSAISGGLVEISGNLDNCTITLPGTVQMGGGLIITGCKFGKSESQHLPAFSFPTNSTRTIFQGCDFDIDGALLYSENTSLIVDLVSCTDSDNWAKAIHNGYAAVNLIGCNCRGNSTATTVDGISINDRIQTTYISEYILTANLSDWKGLPAGTTTDGTWFTLPSLTLDSSEASMDTLRYVAKTDRFKIFASTGGYLQLSIEYPDVTPDAALAPKAVLVRPVMYYKGNDNIPHQLCDGHKFGNGTGFSNVQPQAKVKTTTCVWGGLAKVPNPPDDFAWLVYDEHSDVPTGDWPTHVNPAPEWWSFKIAVLNEAGSAAIPAGTKIKLALVNAYPNGKSNYDTYFNVPDNTVDNYSLMETQQVNYIDCSPNRLQLERAYTPGAAVSSFEFIVTPTVFSGKFYPAWAYLADDVLNNIGIDIETKILGMKNNNLRGNQWLLDMVTQSRGNWIASRKVAFAIR